MQVTMDRFGRVLIPKKLRERLGLTPGEPLALEVQDGQLILEPATPPILTRKGRVIVFEVGGQDNIRAATEENRTARNIQLLHSENPHKNAG